jgi:hypothetical protein
MTLAFAGSLGHFNPPAGLDGDCEFREPTPRQSLFGQYLAALVAFEQHDPLVSRQLRRQQLHLARLRRPRALAGDHGDPDRFCRGSRGQQPGAPQ